MTAIVDPGAAVQGPSTTDGRDDPGEGAVARFDVLGVGVELVSDDPTVVEVVEASYGIFRPDWGPRGSTRVGGPPPGPADRVRLAGQRRDRRATHL